MKTIEEVKNEVAAGLRMRDFHGNLIGDWETFHSIYGIHQNTLEILMKRWAQEENTRLLEEKAKLIEEIEKQIGTHDYTVDGDHNVIRNKTIDEIIFFIKGSRDKAIHELSSVDSGSDAFLILKGHEYEAARLIKEIESFKK